jgi:hypothetical protein
MEPLKAEQLASAQVELAKVREEVDVLKVELALGWAIKYHIANNHQRYNDDRPYAYHPISVANDLADFGFTDWDMQVVALLHDTLEDTDLTAHKVEEQFGVPVHNALILLTRKHGQSYEDYIDGIVNADATRAKLLALLGKRFDLRRNMIIGGRWSEKYMAAWQKVEGALHEWGIDINDPLATMAWERHHSPLATA